MKKLLLLIFIATMILDDRFYAVILEENIRFDEEVCWVSDITLQEAIDGKDISNVTRLIARDPELVNKPLDNTWNPLVYVLHYHGHDYEFVHKVVKLLLENGALVDVWRYEYGYKLAPIHYIAAYGYADMLQMVLNHKPFMNKFIDDGRGATALHYAAGKRLPNLESYKVKGRSWSPSADRRAQLMTDAAIEVVGRKFGYDYRTRLNLTPEEELINRLWVVRNLLESGVAINVLDAVQKTPLDYGSEHFPLVARLLAHWTVKPIEQVVAIEDILKELKSS